MVTNQRSILLQRAMRAEQARKIAEDDAARVREALAEAQSAIRRLQTAAGLVAARLCPVTRVADDGTEALLVKMVRAVRREGNWHSPHTGEQIACDTGVYWLPVETENEL